MGFYTHFGLLFFLKSNKIFNSQTQYECKNVSISVPPWNISIAPFRSGSPCWEQLAKEINLGVKMWPRNAFGAHYNMYRRHLKSIFCQYLGFQMSLEMNIGVKRIFSGTMNVLILKIMSQDHNFSQIACLCYILTHITKTHGWQAWRRGQTWPLYSVSARSLVQWFKTTVGNGCDLQNQLIRWWCATLPTECWHFPTFNTSNHFFLQLSLINRNKSNYLPIGYAFSPHPSIPLKSGNIKYLGITISATLPYLLQLNHIPLLKIIEEDLARWSNLPLSIMGRVATIKMSILFQKNTIYSQWLQQNPTGFYNNQISMEIKTTQE